MTFLRTSRMPAALAERVEKSVTGTGIRRRARGVLRALNVALVVALLVGGIGEVRARVAERDREHRDLEARRDALRTSARDVAAAIGPHERALVPAIEALLVRLAGPYEGDLVADAVRPPRGLDAVLARPTLYVRGSIGGFATAGAIAPAAAASSKDALVLCLLSPPESRTEGPLLARAKRALGQSRSLAEATTSVRRLHDVEASLPFLAPDWRARIDAAHDAAALGRLETAFEKAPVRGALPAFRSEILVAVLDEPDSGAGPTELDGERAHDARVVVVDLVTGEALLRIRRHLDPSWVKSIAARAQYASGIDSCGLALDVREAVTR